MKKYKNIIERKTKNGTSYQVEIKYRDTYGIQRRYSKTFPTLREAKQNAAEMKLKFSAGFQMELTTKKTFKDVAEEFLKNDRSYSHNTMYNTKRYLKTLYETFGAIQINKIDYKLLQEYFNKREKLGLETNKNLKKVFNRIFIYAIRAGYIKDNPIQFVTVTGVKKLRKSKHEIQVITREQFDSIIDYLKKGKANQSYIPAVYLMYMLGLRPSECVCVEFSDVDFEANTISINKKLNYKGLKSKEQEVTDTLKTKASYSELPMPKELRNLLIEWKKINPFKYIVTNSNGLPVNPDVLGNYIRKVAKNIGGLQGFSLYTLRHSYITNLSKMDIDLKTFQDLCRHNNISTSYKYYVHSDNERKQNAISKMFDKENTFL